MRVLLVVNKDWYFLSHRLPLAYALRDSGFEVIIAAGATGREHEITSLGFTFLPIPFERGRLNPFAEFWTANALRKVYKALNPDVVHHVAIKAFLLGSVALLMLPRSARPRVILNTITGRGFLFSGRTLSSRLLRIGLAPLFHLIRICIDGYFIFFNSDDPKYFAGLGVSSLDHSRVICGSGVATDRFVPRIEQEAPSAHIARIVFCSRLLWSKGLAELIAAVKILRKRGVPHRILVAGSRDTSNPEGIDEASLRLWISDGLIEYQGFVADTAKLLSNADIAVLPSHGEGLPLFALEAMACGLPLVMTDTVGCRDCVQEGENGFLVPPHDAPALATALEKLCTNPKLCLQMGAVGRKRAENEFSVVQVSRTTQEFYRELLSLHLPK